MSFSVAVIIVSDRAASGERADGCLSVFQSFLDDDVYSLEESTIVSDDPAKIEKALNKYISAEYNLIFTSGGTGCSPRDSTPEVTARLLDKPTPGLDEAIRDFSRKKAPYAMFSRAVSGISKKSYIINLPGSPKAVNEILEFVLPLISHPLKLISGQINDCQQDIPERDKH
jgi:molybdenum cofactor synthesis domain-containing protein